ncbi:MYB DNA-binding domain-containing protein, partial [Pyrenophora tritici-repentis]
MEPRLNALLDISTQDNASMMSSSGMASPGTERPSHPADPTFVRPKALMLGNSLPENSQANDIRKETQDRNFPTRAMPSAPIAQVLNDEGNRLSAQSVPTTFTSSSTTPFSGRLVDLLLDSPEHSKQRWDQDQQFLQPENTGYSPSVIKLPRLPQPPKRTAKRPRIPPLLQGLHQPPPLPPEGRLFPPITGEKNAFAGDRGYDSLFDESRTKDVDDHAFLENGTQELGRINQHGETMSVSQPGAQNTLVNSTAAVPETDVLTNKATTASDQVPTKRGKKRNRWSEQETKDLLVGVSKFGIGNWKKILQSPDFTFHNRTAVDLKDRFRVCCPGEGLKPRQPKAKGKEKKDDVPPGPSVDASPTHQQPSPSNAENSASTQTIASPKQLGNQQRAPPRNKTVIPDLAELGIREPFSKTTRRPRRAFSANDDMNLLKGFEKYGPVWHFMRDDAELDFGTRHPTDLRDRFRIRYPEKYAKAGYKLKTKEKEPATQDQPVVQHRYHKRHVSVKWLCLSLKPYASSTYLSDPLPTLPFDDENLVDDMGNGDESPITLSRNILRWADANPSSLFTSMTQASSLGAAVNAHTGTLNPPERALGTSMFGGNDGLHGNGGFTTQSQSQMDGARGGSLAEADAWLSASSE